MKKTTDNTKDGIIGRLKKPYEKSMRRRINFDYVLTYLLIGVVVLVVFLCAYGFHYCHSLSENTPLISEEIKRAYIDNNGVINKKLISTAESIVNIGQAKVIAVYNGEGDLLFTTSEALSSKLSSLGRMSIINDVASQFSFVFGGMYKDEAILSDLNLRIVVGYDITGMKNDYAFLTRTMIAVLLFGALVFTFTGYARIQRLLHPIDEMTEVVQKINSDNLNLRLDEDAAKYELKELAITLNSMIDRIGDSYARQKHFVSDVSHELRTPISVISGYASMLKRWGSSDADVLEESIEAIINETANMQNLVEALLFLSRHDNRTIKYEFNEFDLSELVSEVVRDERIIHPEFFLETEVEEALKICADEARVKQLIRILLENAIKYSGSSQKVIVSAARKGSGFTISVQDFGIGISKNDIKKIFDRFYRADESRTKMISGYGLGLSMAEVIIKGHNGKITVKSRENEGSIFTAYIPGKIRPSSETKKENVTEGVDNEIKAY